MLQDIVQAVGGGSAKTFSTPSVTFTHANLASGLVFEGAKSIKADKYVASNSTGGLRLFDGNGNQIYTFSSGTVNNFVFDASQYDKVIINRTYVPSESFSCAFTNLLIE